MVRRARRESRARSRTSGAIASAAALSLCLAALGLAPVRAEDAPARASLNVQRTWRVVGVAAATSVSAAPPTSEIARALEHAGRTVTRELGIEWSISPRIRHARYEDADGRLELFDSRFQALVEGLAESDPAVALADAIFVYVSAPEQNFAGYSALRAHPRGTPPVWYSVVNVRQGPRTARALLEQMEKRSQPLGVELDASSRERSEHALRLLTSPLDRGPLQRLALWATTVHEFGHLLAPGTEDVRAVKDVEEFHARMLQNGPEDPEHHDPACVMWTPDPASILAKLEQFPHVVQFCDGCRRRLGLAPAHR